MIRTLLTTTALVTLLTGGALAQNATTTTTADPNAPAVTEGMTDMPTAFEMGQGYQAVDTDNLASRIIGQPVYTGPAADADNIGNVNDLVVGTGGTVTAAIIGVGGFLGIGEKNVAVPFSQLEWTIAADNTERWTVATTREALDAAPAFEFVDDNPADNAMAAPADNAMAPADNAMAPADATVADNAMAPADNTAMVDPNGQMTDMMVDRTALSGVDASAITAEELIGTRVVGPDDQQIAEVGDLLLTADGQVDAVLVDFGGFLGIGEKRVAVGMDNLEFATDSNGNRYVFLNGITREQLEAAPAYDEATYATDPSQRMTVGAM